ncbi:MAG: metallophosphoesterase family protein [Bacilli bacterium]|nr:metallophosphoesterase family protein [Bacilli bacterium]
MARYAIISDIHANKEALDLIFKDIEKRNCDKIICLGDLVTKYYYPAEVVDAIRANSDIVIKGNCDNLVATNPNYKWARGKLGLERLEYLDNLPLKEQIEINKVLINLYHSTPESLEQMFNPLFTHNDKTPYKDRTLPTNEYNKMFIGDTPQVSFVGHTHQDYVSVENDNKLDIVNSPITLTNQDKAIINVGSIGEHNHMKLNENGVYVPTIDPYLTYAIIDSKANENSINVEIVRVPYTETLKSVYFDMLKKKEDGTAPVFSDDLNKVITSLEEMNQLPKLK